MTAPTTVRMTVEHFHDWLDKRAAALPYDEPKWELFDGVPEMQEHERWVHGRVKVATYMAMRAAIARAGLPLEAALHSIGVRVGPNEDYRPEVVVFPAGQIADHDRFAPNPIIVIEVLSPSSLNKDLRIKAAGYARVPTIEHYLVADPDAREVLHYRRSGDALAPPRGPTHGTLRLDPPGIELTIAELFAAA